MLDVWVSFLRHFLRHFPEGNLEYVCIYIIILFFGGSVRSFYPSRPQYAILGTGILGQIASFERRLRGAAQTPLALPYPFRTWPRSGTCAERDKRAVRKLLYFGRYTPELFLYLGIYAELERKNYMGKTFTF